ncbi:MAG: hypothetical protein NTY53_24845 [Kiritimatiellaeota bacterium]|nr:hypothetical protein [Kiritimatiellota bacterium]
MERLRKTLVILVALVTATAIWLPCLHFFFTPRAELWHSDRGIPHRAQELAERHLQLWTDADCKRREIERMRRSNAEWDFMGRTFLVWSLAEMALRDPAQQPRFLPVMDTIIEETLRLEREHGQMFFLMPYAHARPYVEQPMRSLFVDGEIALMLASRRLVAEKTEYRPLLCERVEAMLARMQRNPKLLAESYPDECWMFDHAVALAAIRASDRLDGSDHTAFIRAWLAGAKKNLTDPATGLLLSSFTTRGAALDGPEGSTIWMVAHLLRAVDADFARDQYRRARRELGRTFLGFGWSREWPRSWSGPMDVDSGMVIPIVEASAGGSGMALIGASSFGDTVYLRALQTSLEFAAFPIRETGRLKYAASNQVGDAALLYACVLGPLWQRIGEARP